MARHQPTATILPRPRLLDLLGRGLSCRLVLAVAPAGYGKTVLLDQWRAQVVEGGGVQSVWLSLDERDADLPHFLRSLYDALAPSIPALAEGRESLPIGSSSDGKVLLLPLLDALISLDTPLLLVLDDVHTIEAGAESLQFLDRLLVRASPYLHLALAARREPPLSAIPRLRVQGQVVEVTAADLCFTTDEVVALFREVHQLELPLSLLREVATWTEGWAVALELARQFVTRHGVESAAQALRLSPTGDARHLYDYLARVVLEGQPETLRTFLRRTAILERLEPALCDALLGRDDAAALLARLERSGLFTFPVDAGRTAYRYHTLFREFLRRRLLEEEGRTVVRQLHRRAAAWLLERGDDERAVVHLLEAEDYEAAAELIRPLAKRLFATSRYQRLEGWLERFPPSFATAHPWLLLIRAELAFARGEDGVAEHLYRQAEPLLRDREDTAGLYSLYYGLAAIAGAKHGDFAAAETLARRALTYAPADDDAAAALGKIAQARYITQGAIPEVFDLLDQALERAARAHNPLRRASLLVLKGGALSNRGDFIAALETWHAALDLMEAYGNRHHQIAVLENAAYHHYLLGQLDRAEALVRRALELARLLDRQVLYGHGLNILGIIHRARGRLEEAQRCHREALTIQQRLNIKYELAPTFAFLALLARRRGQLDEALRLGEEALNHYERMDNAFERSAWLIEMGAIHLAREEDAEAEAMWREAERAIVSAGARYEQAQLHFYQAVLAHHRRDDEALAEHLGQAMALAHHYEHGDPPRCLYFFLEEAAWTIPLMVHALRRGLVPECADCLLGQMGRPAFDTILPLLRDPAPHVRARAAHLLGRLGEVSALTPLAARRNDPDAGVRRAVEEALGRLLSLPPEPLRVQTLGGFRLWRGDREIVRWPRRSARDVFLLLLEQAPRPVPKERLMEWLWPDSPPDKAAQNLRRAIADLRRTLEPELPAGFPSRYVATGDETYALRLPEGSWVDGIAFEKALSRARTRSGEEAIAALEAALALYGGEYLPELPYEEWVLFRRERLRERYREGLLALGRHYEKAGRWQEVVEVARRTLEEDPWSEEATLLLMRAYGAMGDLPAALRAYESLRERLRRDLDLPPCEELTALYRRLRRR